MVDVIYVVANAIHMVIPIACLIRIFTQAMYGQAPPIINTVFFELRPFYLPAVLTSAAIDLATGAWNWGNPIFLAVAALNWWMMRNEKDDDDRWKRRREKLAEKVEAVGGKLTVVPVGSPA